MWTMFVRKDCGTSKTDGFENKPDMRNISLSPFRPVVKKTVKIPRDYFVAQ